MSSLMSGDSGAQQSQSVLNVSDDNEAKNCRDWLVREVKRTSMSLVREVNVSLRTSMSLLHISYPHVNILGGGVDSVSNSATATDRHLSRVKPESEHFMRF